MDKSFREKEPGFGASYRLWPGFGKMNCQTTNSQGAASCEPFSAQACMRDYLCPINSHIKAP